MPWKCCPICGGDQNAFHLWVTIANFCCKGTSFFLMPFGLEMTHIRGFVVVCIWSCDYVGQNHGIHSCRAGCLNMHGFGFLWLPGAHVHKSWSKQQYGLDGTCMHWTLHMAAKFVTNHLDSSGALYQPLSAVPKTWWCCMTTVGAWNNTGTHAFNIPCSWPTCIIHMHAYPQCVANCLIKPNFKIGNPLQWDFTFAPPCPHGAHLYTPRKRILCTILMA